MSEDPRAQAVIFDVDGTLVGDLLHLKKHNYMLSALFPGLNIAITPEEWQSKRGLSDVDFYGFIQARIGALGLPASALPPEPGYTAAATEYLYTHLGDLELRKGADEILDEVRALNLEMAVATNAYEAETLRKLAAVGLDKSFPVIACLNGRIAPKPAPDIYLQAIERIAALRQKPLAAGQSIVLEDTVTGATSGLRAGCMVILWQNPGDAPPVFASDVDCACLYVETRASRVIELIRASAFAA